MQGVLETFYGVFQAQFHLDREQAPEPGELIAPLQDVVFDYKYSKRLRRCRCRSTSSPRITTIGLPPRQCAKLRVVART